MRDGALVTVESGVRLSCVEQGDPNGPAVVLLPGPTDSWRSYEQVLERLPGSIRAVAVSQRGHGDSDKPPGGYGIADFANDAAALLDVLRIERAVLVGHSGSCLVARRVAIGLPDRVAGLVLEASPTTLVGDPGLVDFVASVVADLTDPISPDFARSFAAMTSSSDVARAVLDRAVAELLKVPARVWREVFPALLNYDDTAELETINAPTLLIWGDADPLVGRGMQDELVARIPLAELLIYQGVGHTPRWEAAERFAADLAAFVARCQGQ